MYYEEGPVSYEEDGTKIQQNHYFFSSIENFIIQIMLFDGRDVYL